MPRFVNLPTADGEIMHVNPGRVSYVRERPKQSGCRIFFDKDHSFGCKLDAPEVIELLRTTDPSAG